MPVSTPTFLRISRRLVIALSLLCFLLAAPVQAQTYPHPISLQGLLLDANGDPLSGNYDLTFRIYDTANGGTSLWEETHQNVLVSEGLYGVPLGLNPNLPPDLFIGLPRHLEVSVNGEVLGPRIELQAVPLAYAAKTLTDGALQAGSNVSITRQADGILRIDANGGGGGGGGLSSVATDATLDGDGTSGNPLGLDDNAVRAGANVTVTRNNDGAFVVSSTGGGGGGLSAVSSDATLVGNGTAGSPMGLADGAVTGAKMADGALVAGSNVTITRQGDGAFRIGATGGGSGFSLPFAGSTSSGAAAFSVANTGGGDGIEVSNAGGNGLHVGQANTGVFVGSAPFGLYVGQTEVGVFVGNSGLNGILVDSAQNGMVVTQATNTGLSVGNAPVGLRVLQATDHGVQIDQATTGVNIGIADIGVAVGSAGNDGVYIGTAGNNGVNITTANNDGIFIGTATNAGIYMGSVKDGLIVGGAANDGVVVNSVGRFGLNVVNAVRGVDINTTSSDGLLVRNAGRHGLLVSSASSNGVQIDQANIGLLVGNTGSNGIQVNQAGVDGIQIQNAGRDGIRVSSAGGVAGQFVGDVNVSGTLSKGGGSFKIDHPLDPANKYLQHSFVESPDMMNVYNGNAVLDVAGEAVVTLPDYFETLNRDFRYQLTAIGAPGPNLYIAKKISGNIFRIAGGTPGMEVSWQVTGIRQDAWANENRIVVEKEKPAEERGFYLHPKLYGQPESRSVVRIEDDF